MNFQLIFKGLLVLLLFTSALSLKAFAAFKSIAEVDKHIASSGFNGVVLVMEKNKVLLRKAYGYRDSKTKTPLQVTDRFQIGSNTKQFTAAAILKLQEEKKLNLNDSIADYLPQYPHWSGIKIRDLLNHTSGIRNYSDDKHFMGERTYDKVLTLDEIIDYLNDSPLDFKPRTRYKYSNGGYILAGKIIEVVSGKTWYNYIREQFIAPMGLKDSGHNVFFEEVSPVRGHVGDKIVRNLNLSWALSAGSLYSNADDLAKLLEIHHNSKLIGHNSRVQMHKSFLNDYGLGVNALRYGDDFLVYHSGVTRGFFSKAMFLKKRNIKIVTLDNVNGKVKGIPDLLLKYFYSR